MPDACDYKSITPVIHTELYYGITFIIDILFISPSLNVTLLAFGPIYMATHYLHALTIIEPGDKPSFIIKISFAVM